MDKTVVNFTLRITKLNIDILDINSMFFNNLKQVNFYQIELLNLGSW